MAREALVLCLGLIGWLLWLESRGRGKVSMALWLPTLMVLVLASRTPSLWFGQEVVVTGLPNDSAGNILDQVFFLVVIGGSFFLATRRGIKWPRLLRQNPALMAFYAFFAVSILWSGDPSGSFKRLFKDFGSTVVVIAAILSEKKPLQALRAVYGRCACVLLPLSLLFIRYFPQYGRVYAKDGQATFTGVTVQKNSLGEMVMVFSLFLLWDYRERRREGSRRIPWNLIILLPMAAWLLNISESKTSLVCFLIGAALTVTSGWLRTRTVRRMVFAVALALPFLLFSTQEFSSALQPVLAALGRDATFTGRTDIWAHITASTVNPIVGAGFWNFWGGEGGRAISEAMQTGVPNAHNGYLDIYLDGGITGLILLFLLLVTCGNRLVRRARESGFAQLKYGLLIIAIVANLTESNFARPSLLWFTTVLAFLQVPEPKRRIAAVQPDSTEEAELESSSRSVAEHDLTRAAASDFRASQGGRQ